MIETVWLEKDAWGDWCNKDGHTFACEDSLNELFEIPEKVERIKLAFSEIKMKESYEVRFDGVSVDVDGKGELVTFGTLDDFIDKADLLYLWIYAKVFYK